MWRRFKTTVQGLLACRDWFKAHGVTHVLMEARPAIIRSFLWEPPAG
jgi:hypothetical protein